MMGPFMSAVLLAILYLLSIFTQVEPPIDRNEQFMYLNAEYVAALEVHAATKESENPLEEERIERYQSAPLRKYMQKFSELAQANPEDETAFQCCQWIIKHCGYAGSSDKKLYNSDSTAWQTIARYHEMHHDLPLLCLEAARFPTASREKFLRDLPEDWTQTVEVHGYAILGLAELLAKKYEAVLTNNPANWSDTQGAYENYVRAQVSPEWKEYMAISNAEQVRLESNELFQDVLDHYADISLTVSDAGSGDIATLGERASKSLQQLEKLRSALEVPAMTGIEAREKLLPGN
jgi:hypothetical protein